MAAVVKDKSNDRSLFLTIEKLQTLPQYPQIVTKLLAGETASEVAAWVMDQPNRGPLSRLKYNTMRVFISALNARLKAQAVEAKRTERMRMAAKLSSQAASQSGPESRPLSPEELEAQQNEELKQRIINFKCRDVVNLALELQIPHLKRNEVFEKKIGVPLSLWPKDMEILLSAAELMQKAELSGEVIDVTPEKPLSPTAQRIAQFNDVDRQLLREAAEKFMLSLKRKLEKRTLDVDADKLASDAEGEGPTSGRGSAADTGSDVAGGASAV